MERQGRDKVESSSVLPIYDSPAVAYALGANTVICDTLDDARNLCFRRNEKVTN